jgi:uncharacterized protein (DUF433 family)
MKTFPFSLAGAVESKKFAATNGRYEKRGNMILVIEEKQLKHLPITTDPEILSGAPVFKGTRVPIDALLNNLEVGLTLNEFLDNFPTVTREQALQVLEFSKSTLMRLGKAN